MKKTVTILSGMAIGYCLGVLFAPVSGKELRKILFGEPQQDEAEGREHTYSLSELASPGSTSFEDLRLKIKQAK